MIHLIHAVGGIALMLVVCMLLGAYRYGSDNVRGFIALLFAAIAAAVYSLKLNTMHLFGIWILLNFGIFYLCMMLFTDDVNHFPKGFLVASAILSLGIVLTFFTH